MYLFVTSLFFLYVILIPFLLLYFVFSCQSFACSCVCTSLLPPPLSPSL